jgi:hypothetical protein
MGATQEEQPLIFQSKTTTDLATIRSRLSDADALVARLQLDLTSSAFDCTISGNFTAADAISANLAEAQRRATITRRALAAAEAAEHQRLGEARIKANQVSLRAFRAHCGSVKSAAGLYQEAVEAEEAAWRSLLESAQSARNLLPANRDEYVALFEGALSRECELERSRVGRRNPMTGSHEISLPGTHGTGGADYYKAQPLAERIAAQLAFCSDTFARSLSLQAPPASSPAIADPFTPPLTPGTEAFNAAAEGREPRPTTPRQYVQVLDDPAIASRRAS